MGLFPVAPIAIGVLPVGMIVAGFPHLNKWLYKELSPISTHAHEA